MTDASPHGILGLEPGATRAQVKRAYRRLVKTLHPDAGGDPAAFLAVQEAFERLTAAPDTPTGEAPELVEVLVDRDLRRGTRRDPYPTTNSRFDPATGLLWDCFDQAARYALSHARYADLTLVHGLVADPMNPGGLNAAHGWVEIGDVVFDGLEQRFFTRDSFYAATSARPEVRYDPVELARLVATTGHFGPWHGPQVNNEDALGDTGGLGDLLAADSAYNLALDAGGDQAVALAAYNDRMIEAQLAANRYVYDAGIERELTRRAGLLTTETT